MDTKEQLLNRKSIVVAAAGVAVVALIVVCGVRASFVKSGRIAPGVRVAGVDIGGLAPGEARVRVGAWAHRRMTDPIWFAAGERKWKGELGAVGVTPDVDGMMRSAKAIGREGPVLRRVLEGFGISVRSARLPVRYKYDNAKIDELFAKIDRDVAQPPRDARISFRGGERVITPEAPGTSVDSSDSYRLIRNAVEDKKQVVELPILPKVPNVKASELEKVDTVLASFSTRYPAWKKGRTRNIQLAVAAIDGDLIEPGGVFSYNGSVGPRTKQTGFQDAQIYVDGKIIPGTGGGICQVSSTLYNAALLAGLDIAERSHHSMKVPYVPLGRDATVAYGLLDLKIRNNTSAPVYVSAVAAGSRLTIRLYGNGNAKQDVRIITTRPREVLKKNGKTVTAVTVYRVVSENGVDVRKERVSSDKYNPAPPHVPAVEPALKTGRA